LKLHDRTDRTTEQTEQTEQPNTKVAKCQHGNP
jgi:hypothetical protein